MTELQYLRVRALTGGVDETGGRLGGLPPESLVDAREWVPEGSGRLLVRPNLLLGPQLLAPNGTTPVTAVLAGIGFGGRAVFVSWEQTAGACYVHEWDFAATSVVGKTFADAAVPAAQKWSSAVTTRLPVVLAIFEDAVFISSADRSRALAYYMLGATEAQVVPALDLSTGAAPPGHLRFGTIAEWRNHLFGAGYKDEDDPNVPHAIRWSKPAAAKTAADWVVTDWEYVGAAGESLYAITPIGDQLALLLKASSLHTLTGYSSSTFTLVERARYVGVAGPRAQAVYRDAVWFWTDHGKPAVFGGGEVVELDTFVRDTLRELDFSDPHRLWVQPYPQYSLVLYGAPRAGASAPDRILVYDTLGQRWLGRWSFPGAAADRAIFACVPIERLALQGPVAPPSGLQTSSATATSYRATWQNGDSSPGTTTVVEHREAVPANAPFADLVTLDAVDQTHYDHTGLGEKRTYETRIRHERNGILNPADPAQRPVAQALTRCHSAPLEALTEPAVGGQVRITINITSRSGRAGATSTITLRRQGEVVQTYPARADEATPTILAYSEIVGATPKPITFKSRVTDDAATWPQSFEETVVVIPG